MYDNHIPDTNKPAMLYQLDDHSHEQQIYTYMHKKTGGQLSLGTAKTRTTPLTEKYLLVLLDSQADSSPEVLHQNLRLFHLGRVYLRPHHGTERHLHSDRNASNVCCYKMTKTRGHTKVLHEHDVLFPCLASRIDKLSTPSLTASPWDTKNRRDQTQHEATQPFSKSRVHGKFSSTSLLKKKKAHHPRAFSVQHQSQVGNRPVNSPSSQPSPFRCYGRYLRPKLLRNTKG